MHFVFEAEDDVTNITEFPEHRWIGSVDEMSELRPRIPGIDNHAATSSRRLGYAEALARAIDRLESLQSGAGRSRDDLDISELRSALRRLTWSTTQETDLTRAKYLNP